MDIIIFYWLQANQGLPCMLIIFLMPFILSDHTSPISPSKYNLYHRRNIHNYNVPAYIPFWYTRKPITKKNTRVFISKERRLIFIIALKPLIGLDVQVCTKSG